MSELVHVTDCGCMLLCNYKACFDCELEVQFIIVLEWFLCKLLRGDRAVETRTEILYVGFYFADVNIDYNVMWRPKKLICFNVIGCGLQWRLDSCSGLFDSVERSLVVPDLQSAGCWFQSRPLQCRVQLVLLWAIFFLVLAKQCN